MLIEELIELVNRICKQKAEGQTIELKSAQTGCPKRLYDTLSSFSNQDSGGIIVFALLAYGLRRAGRFHVNFNRAAVLAVLMIPHSALILADFLIPSLGLTLQGDVLTAYDLIYKISYVIYYALYMAFHALVFTGAAAVYKAGGAAKYASRAMSRLYMTAVYVIWTLILFFVGTLGNAAIGGALQIYKYLVWLINTLFFYDCFARITTPEQLAREKAAGDADDGEDNDGKGEDGQQ